MKDRIAGAPGQYSAVVTGGEYQKLQSGQPFNITIMRDDKPEVEGTPYSKAAVLPDDLAETLCPDIEDPTPADALKALSTGKAPSGYGYGDKLVPIPSDDDDTSFVENLSAQFALIPHKTMQIIFIKDGVYYIGTLWNAGNNYGTLIAYSYLEPEVKHHFHQLVRICTEGVWGEWVNFSPSAFITDGYGLGEVTPKKVSSADEALATGWYQLPATATEVVWLYCASYSKNIKRQELYTKDNHQVRYMSKGEWQPWEWVTPPMISTKEYRTTERRNGEPVYTVAACNVPLTNSTNQHVKNLIDPDAKDIHIEGFANNTKSGISYPLYRLNLSVVACDNGTNKGYLSVAAHENLSDWKATFILKYVK